MTTETLLLFIVIIFFAAVFPTWPHSKSWGYAPTGILTLLLVIIIFWAMSVKQPLFKRLGGNIESTVQVSFQK